MKTVVTALCALLIAAQIGYLFVAESDGLRDSGEVREGRQSEQNRVGLSNQMDLDSSNSLQMQPALSSPSDDPEQAESDTEVIGGGNDGRQEQGRFKLSGFKSEPSAAAARSDEEIRMIAQGSAVQIRDSMGELVGSGVIVAIGARSFDVLTAFHVIDGRDRFGVSAFIESGTDSIGPTHSFDVYVRHWGVVVIDTDREKDLAYLRVASLNRPREVVCLAADPVDGHSPSAAWVIDSTESGPPDVQKVNGLMLETAKRPEEGHSVQMWRIDQQSKPGMSGSALLNAQGRLIGMASGNNDGAAYYCGLNHLREFLHRVAPNEVRVLRGDRDASDAEGWLGR